MLLPLYDTSSYCLGFSASKSKLLNSIKLYKFFKLSIKPLIFGIVHLSFGELIAAMFILFCEIPKHTHAQKKIPSCLMVGPALILIKCQLVSPLSGLTHLTSWLSSLYSEIYDFLRMKFITFTGPACAI